MNSKGYKCCAVPQCTSTSLKTPNKLFVYLPNEKTKRDKWLTLARRDPAFVSPRTALYFCEDHFDLPNDMDNYIRYTVMGSVSQVRMKPGCIPTKFECQSQTNEIAHSWNSMEQLFYYIGKKNMMMVVKEDSHNINNQPEVQNTAEKLIDRTQNIRRKDVQNKMKLKTATDTKCRPTKFECQYFKDDEIQPSNPDGTKIEPLKPFLKSRRKKRKNVVEQIPAEVESEKYIEMQGVSFRQEEKSEQSELDWAVPTIKMKDPSILKKRAALCSGFQPPAKKKRRCKRKKAIPVKIDEMQKWTFDLYFTKEHNYAHPGKRHVKLQENFFRMNAKKQDHKALKDVKVYCGTFVRTSHYKADQYSDASNKEKTYDESQNEPFDQETISTEILKIFDDADVHTRTFRKRRLIDSKKQSRKELTRSHYKGDKRIDVFDKEKTYDGAHNQNEPLNEATDSAESFETFKCDYCGMEFIRKGDMFEHIQEQHLDIQEESLDIKPEIYQCNKCPSSFLNEDDMSQHIQIMHGDLINKYITQQKSDRNPGGSSDFSRDNEFPDDLNYIVPEDDLNIILDDIREDIEQDTTQVLKCDKRHIETTVEIKRETDALEDLDEMIEIENQQIEDQIRGIFQRFTFDLDQNVSDSIGYYDENIYSNTYNDTDAIADPSGNNIKLETDDESTKSADIANTRRCEFCFAQFLDVIDLSRHISDRHSDLNSKWVSVNCKTCHIEFPSQEKLLDHIHDLIHLKAKLYASAKSKLNSDVVHFRRQEEFDDGTKKSKFLSEAELIDSIHRIYYNDRTNSKRIQLEIVGSESVEDSPELKENEPEARERKSFCTKEGCFKPLAKRATIQGEKYCPKCKKIESKSARKKIMAREKLYAEAKEALFKQVPELESARTSSRKQKSPVNDEALLDNVHEAFNKKNERMSKTEMVNEIEESSILGDDNELLQPIWEEEEKILVSSHDPNLCKSCLKPLSTKSQPKSKVCSKCKSLERTNDKRKKIDFMKRRKSAIDRTQETAEDAAEALRCTICRKKCSDMIDLRIHVMKSHYL